MTDNEIIKALEMCILGDCQGCFYGNTDQRHCRDDLMKHSLDLINRLQAEVEELKTAMNCYRSYEEEQKAIAIKEFAERLKESMERYDDEEFYAMILTTL